LLLLLLWTKAGEKHLRIARKTPEKTEKQEKRPHPPGSKRRTRAPATRVTPPSEAPMAGQEQPDFRLTLRPLPDPDGIPADARLKGALKRLLRSFGLKCLLVERLPTGKAQTGTTGAAVRAPAPQERNGRD
jgi:hypothetical protein